MSDLFQAEPNHQLVKEARRGIVLLLVTVAICGYFLYQRTRAKLVFPEHVLNAPIARDVNTDPRLTVAEQAAIEQRLQQEHQSRLAEIRQRMVRQEQTERRRPSEVNNRIEQEIQVVRSGGELRQVNGEVETRNDRGAVSIPSTANVSRDWQVQLANMLPFGKSKEKAEAKGSQTKSNKSETWGSSHRRPEAAFSQRKGRSSVASNSPSSVESIEHFADRDLPNSNSGKMGSSQTVQPPNIPCVDAEVARRADHSDLVFSPSPISPMPDNSNELRTGKNMNPIPSGKGQKQFESPRLSPADARPSEIPGASEDGSGTQQFGNSRQDVAPSQWPQDRSNALASTKTVLDQEGRSLAEFNPVKPHPDALRAITKELNPSSFEVSSESAGNTEPPRMFRVTDEQTLWDVAVKVYGDGRLFRALHALNKVDLGESELTANLMLRTPNLEFLRKNYRSTLPFDLRYKTQPGKSIAAANDELESRVLVTKAGDTLFSIACDRLGQGSRYMEIIEMNQFRLPKRVTGSTLLPVNTKLLLPE